MKKPNSFIALDIDPKTKNIGLVAWEITEKLCKQKTLDRTKRSYKIIPFNIHFKMSIESWLMEFGIDKETIRELTKIILEQLDSILSK